MRRSLMVGAAVLGVALCARQVACRSSDFDFERMIDRMPENAPPKWVFRNVTAIRENTERILVLLESGRTQAPGERPPAAA